jgi:hypothetical protein
MTSRHPFLAGAAASLLACASGPCCAQAGRYVYVIGCDAQVTKLDTLERRRVASIELAGRSGAQAGVPRAEGAIDDCLATNVVFDASTARAWLAAPETSRLGGRPQRLFRVLGYNVPDWRLVRTLPAGGPSFEAPRIALDGQHLAHVTPAQEAMTRRSVDLDGVAGADDAVGNELLESSGAVSLVRLYMADAGALVFAVVDERARTLVRLNDLPPTTALRVHLVPGGAFVLVEQADGAAWTLHDAPTGARVASFAPSALAKDFYLGVAPTGIAVVRAGRGYRFIDLGRHFPPIPVTRSVGDAEPGVFFFDR